MKVMTYMYMYMYLQLDHIQMNLEPNEQGKKRALHKCIHVYKVQS